MNIELIGMRTNNRTRTDIGQPFTVTGTNCTQENRPDKTTIWCTFDQASLIELDRFMTRLVAMSDSIRPGTDSWVEKYLLVTSTGAWFPLTGDYTVDAGKVTFTLLPDDHTKPSPTYYFKA